MKIWSVLLVMALSLSGINAEAAKRLERVLTTDPGMGIVRHADAGYPQAIEAAKRHGIKMPMLKS